MIVTDRTIRLIATPDPAAMNPVWSQVIIHKAGRQKCGNAEEQEGKSAGMQRSRKAKAQERRKSVPERRKK